MSYLAQLAGGVALIALIGYILSELVTYLLED